jgi:glutathione gamma-glutamylcysteinyltransferase
VDTEAHNPNCRDAQYKTFRQRVIESCSSDKAQSFIISHFSRKRLGQTGDGHFSPIGGVHLERDLVLIMDVARFKYPPFWVPFKDLWEAMATRDVSTNEPRGYFVVNSKDVVHSYSKANPSAVDNLETGNQQDQQDHQYVASCKGCKH